AGERPGRRGVPIGAGVGAGSLDALAQPVGVRTRGGLYRAARRGLCTRALRVGRNATGRAARAHSLSTRGRKPRPDFRCVAICHGRTRMPTTDQPLSGKVAIVTGAGRGIGKAIAQADARAGAAVCCAARTEVDVRATAQTIMACGGQGLAVSTDVSQLAAVQQMVQVTVKAFGGLDILVINAGIDEDRRSVADSDPEAWPTTLHIT